MALHVDNILDLSNALDQSNVERILARFSCSRNPEVERFAHDSAMNFANQGISSTFLVRSDGCDEIVGYFTLANKVLQLSRKGLSSTLQRKLGKFASDTGADGEVVLAAPIIAQVGRDDRASKEIVSGSELIGLATSVIERTMHDVGGRVVYLECEDEPNLLAFYEREGFRAVGTRVSESDVTYHVLIKFLSPIGGDARAA